MSTSCTMPSAIRRSFPLPLCTFAYYHWCGRCLGDQDTECPLCVQAHGVIQEIRRNDERLADQHNRFLGDAKENGFRAVTAVFGRLRIRDIATWCRLPCYGSLFPLTLYLYPLKLGRHGLCHLFQAYQTLHTTQWRGKSRGI